MIEQDDVHTVDAYIDRSIGGRVSNEVSFSRPQSRARTLPYLAVCILVHINGGCLASISYWLFPVSVELDVNALRKILSTFAGRMGPKWDFIGIQLHQGELVQDLRSSPQLGKQKVQQIIDEWLGSDDKEVPVCAATVSRVLRSPAVRLGAVAKKFEEVKHNTVSRCVWAMKGSSQLSNVCMCSACTVYCQSLPHLNFAIGSAKEGILSACCSTTSSLMSSTKPPFYWSLPF